MKSPPIILQFYDWFREESWIENNFPDKIKWSELGIIDGDRTSFNFYKLQFEFIKSIGVDAIAWQYNYLNDLSTNLPSKEVISALQSSGLKCVPFLDLEISFKCIYNTTEIMNATLTSGTHIRPDTATVDLISNALENFYRIIPDDLRVKDIKGRDPIFVFGYCIDRNSPKPDAFYNFATRLIAKVKEFVNEPFFAWTFVNTPFMEHLLIHHRNNFGGFNFVLDTPQGQFGHDVVTWNFGFDNSGAANRDGLERVVRNDLRYYEEMIWMAGASDPAMVYIYGWNEPFEGSMLIPTERWGTLKANLANYFIRLLKSDVFLRECFLPKVVIVINDPELMPDDWHTFILRALLWYPFKRFVPQADLITVGEAVSADLSKYRYIIDFTLRKSESFTNKLLNLTEEQTLLFINPFSALVHSPLCDSFHSDKLEYKILERDVEIEGVRKIYVRDDIVLFSPSTVCKVRLYANIDERRVPLVSRVGNRIWLNSFSTDDLVLSEAFSELYSRPMGDSILFGEGLDSQRLLITPAGAIVKQRFLRKAVIQRWHIPERLLPIDNNKEFDNSLNRFIFGLDD